MNHTRLFENIVEKSSFLCVGLDSEIEKIPSFLLKGRDPQFEFNKRIIDATHKYAVAYKPNVAFYECYGAKGWTSLESTVRYIKDNYPEIFLIADAKRGDIGNTSKMYAKAFLENMPFDAITVAPYMGEDSVTPFLSYAEMLKEIRQLVPEHFLLVPGVGAQGGSLEEVAKYGLNSKCGLLVNSSRGIIFADNSKNFDKVASEKAQEIQVEMEKYLRKHKLI